MSTSVLGLLLLQFNSSLGGFGNFSRFVFGDLLRSNWDILDLVLAARSRIRSVLNVLSHGFSSLNLSSDSTLAFSLLLLLLVRIGLVVVNMLGKCCFLSV